LNLLDYNATLYEVLIDKRVEKDLKKVPHHIVEKFLNILDKFEKNPITRGLDLMSDILKDL